VILGASGTCLDILDTALELEDVGVGPPYDCIGFLDDDPEKQVGTGSAVLHDVPARTVVVGRRHERFDGRIEPGTSKTQAGKR
jgi:serine acetyltransferase